ncbi:DNA alkylation repair protein [Streptococcus marimammalium]|uniref:DNA alkylation repair protein n=1 Tax=Streptococcus marimammalium TaxID=269666 RepID=UPI000379B7EF|nr:DNA alkylation repair protein [Streptococcus marimammalium]
MISNKIVEISNDFNSDKFLELTRNSIEQLEFNQRQDLIAKALFESINLGYEETLLIFYQMLGDELKGNSGSFSEGWWLWPIGKYVELYGDNYLEASLNFSKELTKRFTSEYCMRPLIKKYPKETMTVLEEWSVDENERVRRLSSECLRIRLPWAKKLYTALDNFDQYFKILMNLKDDKDKYIQKSVANNLNDLYKEDEEKFYFIINDWEKGDISKECQWVIKHGSRNVK